MPLLRAQTINNNSSYGIWEITESVDELLSKLSLSTEEKNYYNKFKNELRQKHWLSYRHILKALLKDDGKYNITYNENGKPILTPQDYSISVSHSGNKSVAIISKSSVVGIDIELMSDKIFKLKKRFMSDFELNNISKEFPLEYIYVHWSSKESLCKMIDNKTIIFNEELQISPFAYQQKGIIQANINTKNISQNCQIHYEAIDKYMFTFTEPSN